jgi:tripartite-type tricarboxylate transporter receptor subunit TctC
MMFSLGRVVWSIVLSVTMALGVPVPSHAQYPSRVIQIIAPVPPGGNVDLLARAIAPSMSEMLGQPVIVVNKTGASGNLGAEFVAKAPPDGYTLLLTGSFIAIGASFYKNLSYDVRRDFTEIARLVSSPNLIVVSGTSPFKSVAELIAFARANPGKLNFASIGVGTSIHLCGELFKLKTAIDIVHIPYRAYPDAITSVIRGDTHLICDSLPVSLANIGAGRTRPLAVADAVRSPALPDVPTLAEVGVPGIEIRAWFGVAGPAGLPATITERLQQVIGEAMKSSEFVKMTTTMAMDPGFQTSAEFTEYFNGEIDKWAAIIKAANVKPEQ